MKRANGMGSIIKMAGNRRKPYAVVVTVIVDGFRKKEYIGFFERQSDAQIFLAHYNENPSDRTEKSTTFAQLYDMWYFAEVTDDVGDSTIKGYRTNYANLEPLHDMILANITVEDCKKTINALADRPASAATALKLMKRVFKWAVDTRKLSYSPAETVKTKKKYAPKKKNPFTDTEIKQLREEVNTDVACAVLYLLIYSGLRIHSLLELTKDRIDLETHMFRIEEDKTEAGTRLVPIHDYIYPLVTALYNSSQSEYLINGVQSGTRIFYTTWQKNYMAPLMERLGWKHTTHDTRHTFSTLATRYDMNPTIKKMIMGHKSQMELHEAVYTHEMPPEKLLAEINKIR